MVARRSRSPARCSSSARTRSTVDVPRAGPAVDGDPVRLAQVVREPADQRRQVHRRRGGRIDASARRDGRRDRAAGEDNGIGIAPEHAAAASSTCSCRGGRRIDRAEGGLGLGLTHRAQPRRSCTAAPSSALQRRPGQGQRVRRAPAARRAGAARSRHADGRRGRRRSRPRRRRARPHRRRQRRRRRAARASCCEAIGHEDAVAHDGPRRCERRHGFKPDVALLDIGLPVMDGYELATRLREMPGLAGIRLVAVTGYGQESDRQRRRPRASTTTWSSRSISMMSMPSSKD